MPEVTSHAQGAPSWAELDTTDDIGALAFYSALFGWEDDPQEMAPNWYYHMQRINDLPACSIYKQSEEEQAQNVPPPLEHLLHRCQCRSDRGNSEAERRHCRLRPLGCL